MVERLDVGSAGLGAIRAHTHNREQMEPTGREPVATDLRAKCQIRLVIVELVDDTGEDVTTLMRNAYDRSLVRLVLG